jgi:hypothetical protein
MRALPWIIAAAFAISTLVLALRSPASQAAPGPSATPAAAETAPPAPTTADTTPATSLAALRRCMARLDVAQAMLARNATPGDAGAPCAVETAELAEEVRTLHTRERDERRTAMRGMVQDYLGISAEQSGWLMDYVCAVRGLRADVLEDVRAQKIDLKEAASRQKAEREDALADIERILGPDKYQQLRSVGGLGKLGDLFECI